jgi:hypothetical protein
MRRIDIAPFGQTTAALRGRTIHTASRRRDGKANWHCCLAMPESQSFSAKLSELGRAERNEVKDDPHCGHTSCGGGEGQEDFDCRPIALRRPVAVSNCPDAHSANEFRSSGGAPGRCLRQTSQSANGIPIAMRKKPPTMASKRPIYSAPPKNIQAASTNQITRPPRRRRPTDEHCSKPADCVGSDRASCHPPSIFYEQPTFKSCPSGLPMIAAGISRLPRLAHLSCPERARLLRTGA